MKLYKKITLTILLLIILAIIFIVIVLANLNSIIASNKGLLEEQASNSLNTPVKIDKVEVQYVPLGLKASGFKLGKGNESCGVDNLFASVNILPLLKKNLEITKIEVISPKLTINKDKQGAVKISGLPQVEKKTEQKNLAKAEQKAESDVSTALPFSMNLNSFSLKDGKINYNDASSGLNINVTKLNINSALSLDDTSANLPKGDLKASINDNPISLSYNGLIYKLQNKAVKLPSATFKTDFANFEIAAKTLKNSKIEVKINDGKIIIAKLLALLTKLKLAPELDLKGEISTKLIAVIEKTLPSVDGKISLKDLASSKFKINAVNGDISLQHDNDEQRIKIEPLKLDYSGTPLNLRASLNLKQTDNLILDNLQIHGFGGEVESLGNYNLKEKNFTGKVEVKKLQLAELLKISKPDLASKISGVLESLKLNIKGNQKNISSSIQGEATAKLTDAELKQFNIIRNTLSKIPLLVNAINNPDDVDLNKILTSKGTQLKSVDTALKIQGENIKLNRFTLESELFNLEGSGTINLQTGYNLKATLILSKKLSRSISKRVKEIALNNQEKLEIPLSITGKIDSPTIIPDLEATIKNQVKEKIKDEVKKNIDKGVKKGLSKLVGKLF